MFDAVPFAGTGRMVGDCDRQPGLIGEPLRHPRAPGLSLAGIRLIIPDHAMGLPVLRALSLCTCCRHYPGAADGRTPRSNLPSRISLPRFHYRVGLHIDLFEVCSAFTRVAACTLAQSPNS